MKSVWIFCERRRTISVSIFSKTLILLEYLSSMIKGLENCLFGYMRLASKGVLSCTDDIGVIE